jgi:phosphoribosyl-ATP pyrophosphohydrolase
MAKTAKKATARKPAAAKKAAPKKAAPKAKDQIVRPNVPASLSGEVLDRLWGVVMDRRSANPAHSHSARLLSRGTSKVAQKFGEEAVECLIEAVSGNNPALISESADVLYHLLVMWVAAGIEPADVWSELARREGISGVIEKASRLRSPLVAGTTKIP